MYLQPKEIQVNGKTFVIHKLPATVAIEVMARGVAGAIPKTGDFAVVEEMMIKTMGYVAIRKPGVPDLFITSKELIDNQCVDYKTYLSVLEAIREYNDLFFIAGSLSNFYENTIMTLPAKIMKMFIHLSQSSSTQESQNSMS